MRLTTGLDELPNGLDPRRWQLLDLDGEGLPGLLTEQDGAWRYKRNEGAAHFAPARLVDLRPPLAAHPGARLTDIDGDGRLDLVLLRPAQSGHQPRTADGGWDSFRPFPHAPNHRADGPDARLIDVDGDGFADLIITEGDTLIFYPSLGRDGFGPPVRVPMPADDDHGPRFLFSRDGAEVYLADMTGDGLPDVVRVRNGSVCYWPALGRGRFGAKVRMKSAPRFDQPDRFDPARLRLIDIDGTGPTDLLYLGPDACRVWMNQSGNGFAEAVTVRGVPVSLRPEELQVADLYGDGTACLVWMGPVLRPGAVALQQLRLLSTGKPWLLTTSNNGLGREVRLTYTPSTAFYLNDRAAGRPWATRLPFPVHCLSKMESFDAITGWRFVSEYAYHHGFFDGEEREFRGFGLVEQWDTERASDHEDPALADPAIVVQQPPIRTRTWFHTGAWLNEGNLATVYAAEYFTHTDAVPSLAAPTVPSGLTPAESREAHRALRGRTLRQEVYVEDDTGELVTLVAVSEQTHAVVRLQPRGDAPHAVFRIDAGEALQLAYELDLTGSDTPDPRVSHSVPLVIDDYGVVTRSAALVYPRRGSGHDDEQTALHVVLTETTVVHQDAQVTTDDLWRLAVPTETKSWALTDTDAWTDTTRPTAATLNTAFTSATAWRFDETPTGTGPHKRLLGHQRTLYWNDALSAALTFGSVGQRALPHTRYALAMTEELITAVFDTDVDATLLTEAGYVDLLSDDDAWLPSGRLTHDPALFYLPSAAVDPFGLTTTLTWDAEGLALLSVEDPAGLVVSATIDYQRLAPTTVTDPNGTESSATFDPLGRVLTTSVRNGAEGDGTGEHSAELHYDTDTLPASVHTKLLKEYGGTDWLESWAYSDGGGNIIQTKVQAAPGDAPTVTAGVVTWGAADPRFIGTGRVILDNKGNVIKQYEPFFSTTSAYEDEAELVEWGVCAVHNYDPLGRNIQVTLPDGHTQTWTYGPWSVEAHDEEDNRSGGDHEGTPTTTHLDTLGRVYKLVERPDTSTTHTTRIELDILGNALDVIDPRGNRLQARIYDLLGHALFTGAADEGYTSSSSKGETRILPDAAGTPLRSWRSGGLSLRPLHDAARRPIGLLVDEGAGERLVSLSIFGDALSDLPSTNHALGRPVHIYDTAGRVTLTYDLKGRVTAQTRTLLADITTEADWSGLESEGSLADIATWLSTDASLSTDTADTFAVSTAYDALDRVTEQTAPDTSRTVPTYDAGGRLSQVEVYVRGDTTATEIVSSITTNARGQREQIVYGNHTQTSYAYDPERLWLTGLTTTRSSASSHGAATLQDLGFTRDAVGNITEITDDAQETVYFGNSQVSPTRTFTYDALYRLVSARGREKDAQTQSTAFYADYAGAMGTIPQSGSGVLRRYTQSFEYDAAGNILEVKHQQGDAGTVLWRRGYAYETDNNQLLSTSLPGDDPDDPGTHSQTYAMNDRGAIVYLPHLKTGVSTNLVRDFRDQLRKAELDNAGNVSWYAYDAAGERVWKVWDKGSVVEERIYLGGYEVWRKRNGSGVLQEERQTLHVMDDQRRVAMIETLTVTGGSAVSTPTPRFRYQLDDQLGSALLEVDDDGGVISYEEYHPYGTTAWWAEDAAIEVSRKRYRYTGKERDEETGLQYHSARYYAPWLGRWDRPDPIGLGDGGNRWGYVGGRPSGHQDPLGTQGQPDAVTQFQSPAGRSVIQTMVNLGMLSAKPAAQRAELAALVDDSGTIRVQIGEYEHQLVGAGTRGTLLNGYEPLSPQTVGVVQLIGGGAEVVAGGLGIAAPEPLTTAGGVVLVAHGLDSMAAGYRALSTGEYQTTVTAASAETLALAVGAEPETAHVVGVAADIVVPFASGVAASGAVPRMMGWGQPSTTSPPRATLSPPPQTTSSMGSEYLDVGVRSLDQQTNLPPPGEYLAGKAPKLVAPGTRILTGQYINDLGRVEPWTAHYDEFGRLIARTDFNAGNRTEGIPATHYHTYDWRRYGAHATRVKDHEPGEYTP
ncbi:MAG: toxin [Deltaproteobacteria bacterium]|nr:toxin [Deltaproteobacteria bacterium]